MGNHTSGLDEDRHLSEGFKHSLRDIKRYRKDLENVRKSYPGGPRGKDPWVESLAKNSGEMEKFFTDFERVVERNSHAVGKDARSLASERRHPNELQEELDISRGMCASLNLEIEKLTKKEQRQKEEFKKLGDLILQLKQERDELTISLSNEMANKVSKDESNLENISIKNRPMKIAEEYDILVTHSWLAAKEVLDELLPLEEQRVAMLRDIMKAEAEVAREKHKEITTQIFTMISTQAEFGTAEELSTASNAFIQSDTKGKGKKMKAAERELIYEKIPGNLKIAIGDFLRITADTADVRGISQNISKMIRSKMNSDEILANMAKTMKEKSKVAMADIQITSVNAFIDDFARLAWKMATQRPQMTFDDKTGVGEKWKGEKLQSVSFGSEDPERPNNVVKYYDYPTLLHGDRVMKIGRVYIAKKD